jgi:methyl-accepting chemotaxis protein
LSRGMESVSLSGNPSARLTITGDDELASLGHDVNKMLTAIELAQITARQNEERLRTSLNELERSQSELDDNDYQLQITVSRVESQKRQLQRMYEFMRSTAMQMEDSLYHGASSEELIQYLKSLQTQLNRLDKEIGEMSL